MKKYKVIKNKRPIKLTEEQILKHKNFDKLFMSYEDLTKRNKTHISQKQGGSCIYYYWLLLRIYCPCCKWINPHSFMF